MTKLYFISDWSEQTWLNTGGTRNKKIYLNPDDGKRYYFKESFNQGERDYKYEFWSEILASKVGQYLGFELLDYNIAIAEDNVGCLSESMIDSDSQELTEGVKYLSAFDPTFIVDDGRPGKKYTFDLIEQSLKKFELEKHIDNILEIIVFDALIGNSDRHQENWAIINKSTSISKSISAVVKANQEGLFQGEPKSWVLKQIKKLIYKKGEVRSDLEEMELFFKKAQTFAPIYDSGCCFGRELSDERIQALILDPLELEKYIEKGKSEIHLNDQKLTHFDLIRELLLRENYKQRLFKTHGSLIEKYNSEDIHDIIRSVDQPLLELDLNQSLPRERKEFIIKLLDLRFNRLKEIYNAAK
jgi:hypothetical protein